LLLAYLDSDAYDDALWGIDRTWLRGVEAA
jgi:hypothetical protein